MNIYWEAVKPHFPRLLHIHSIPSNLGPFTCITSHAEDKENLPSLLGYQINKSLPSRRPGTAAIISLAWLQPTKLSHNRSSQTLSTQQPLTFNCGQETIEFETAKGPLDIHLSNQNETLPSRTLINIFSKTSGNTLEIDFQSLESPLFNKEINFQRKIGFIKLMNKICQS